MKIDYIPCIYATDFDKEVTDYCDEHDIPTHCDSDVILIENDENPLAKLVKANGYEFKNKYGDIFAIIGT